MESNKKMGSTKAYVLGALIITVSLIIIGVSMSYAYFVNRIEEVNPDNKEVRITSGELIMNLATSRTISKTAVGLINDSDITKDVDAGGAEYTEFSITLPSTSKVNSAKYTIFLTELEISDNLKSEYLKWALYSGDTVVKSGNFGDIGEKTALTLTDTPIVINKGDTDTTTSYKLYIWLSNDPNNNQISLLDGSFSGKVGFRATT